MNRFPPMPELFAAKSPDLNSEPLTIVASADFTLEAAEGGGESLPKFSMLAYTGDMLRQPWAAYPIVVDLSTAVVPDKDIPALYNHDPLRIVGHGRGSASPRQIKFSGIVSGVGPDAQEVKDTSKNGFPWQASIRGPIPELVFVERGQTVKANGKTFQGPIYVARRFELREVSFVSLGEDGNTNVAVAASANNSGVTEMDFEQWLSAKGFTGVSDEQKKVLKAAFDAEQNPPPANPQTGTTVPVNTPPLQAGLGGGTGNNTPPTDPVPNSAELIAQMRADAAAEQQRISKINTLCAGHPEIQAKAIGEGWTPDRAELEVLRASRPRTSGVHVPDHTATPQVLQAALCAAGKLESIEDHFDDQTLQAAHTQFKRGISLQELYLTAAWEGGYTGRSIRGNLREVLQAAFSTTSLSGILSNTANKFLLEGYMFVENAWRKVARIGRVNDFKTRTSYQMLSGGKFRKVGASGELTHGQLTEQSYPNKAETYGEILSITRQDMINDDLDALSARPKVIGRDAGLALNEVFWAEFLNNSTFFTSGRGNYAEGAGTELGIDALTAAELLFLNQTGADGKPLGLSPAVLLTSSAYKVTAEVLMKSLEIRDTTASKKTPTDNPHAGKFEPVFSRYLNNAQYTGYSDKAWYLLADPADEAVIEIVFLNGQEEPVIESADADFATLGTQLRGYFDFGVAKREYRAGTKQKGEA